ncbi:BNR repeat-containing protein [Anopheles sinensis]|uniref:BNR repeat-containing protein n=1 Tax=Anopheles sinensis TaxID=74873 RepID=A0A084WLB6_ANOSI|nr:BNR repeat-containing protein [Anopheles sinensis]
MNAKERNVSRRRRRKRKRRRFLTMFKHPPYAICLGPFTPNADVRLSVVTEMVIEVANVSFRVANGGVLNRQPSPKLPYVRPSPPRVGNALIDWLEKCHHYTTGAGSGSERIDLYRFGQGNGWRPMNRILPLMLPTHDSGWALAGNGPTAGSGPRNAYFSKYPATTTTTIARARQQQDGSNGFSSVQSERRFPFATGCFTLVTLRAGVSTLDRAVPRETGKIYCFRKRRTEPRAEVAHSSRNRDGSRQIIIVRIFRTKWSK